LKKTDKAIVGLRNHVESRGITDLRFAEIVSVIQRATTPTAPRRFYVKFDVVTECNIY